MIGDSPMTDLLQDSVRFLDRYRLAVQIADALSCRQVPAAERICNLSLPDNMVLGGLA